MEPTARIGELLARGAANGVFAGAQAAWRVGGGAVAVVCAGSLARGGPDPVTPETRFDIASLTKVFTASAALRLAARGELDLGARLDALWPGLEGAATATATLEQLLAHEAGFAEWAPLFEQVEPEIRGSRAGKAAVIELSCGLAAAHEPGRSARYSDLGFVVLGAILERAAGERLDAVVAREVTEPLSLGSIRYRPRAILRSSAQAERSRTNDARFAATEHCPWRGRVLVGEVHDDNAWTMGGVAGHAGLFAGAGDVALLGSAWLEALESGGWLPAGLAARAVERRPLGRGLGWDLKSEAGSSAGELMGPRTFGHLGFTGCSLWVDPDAGLSAALLTNRVHPTRDNEAIREFRPRFHDTLMGVLGR